MHGEDGPAVALANDTIRNWEQASKNDKWQRLNIAAKYINIFPSEPNKYTTEFILSKRMMICISIMGIPTSYNSLSEYIFKIEILQGNIL